MNEQKTQVHAAQRRNYLERLKILPVLKEQKTQAYLTLAFTFAALSIFGLFAINPTLTTIADLQKQLEESKVIKEQLDTKIANLYALQNEYYKLQPDLPVVFSAIPNKPEPAPLLGKIQAIAAKDKLSLMQLESFQVDLMKKSTDPKAKSSYTITIQGQGSYEQLAAFIESFTHFDRILTIESLSI